MGNFKNLRVWQDAMSLAEKVYTMIKDNPVFSRDFALRDQIVRAVISVPSNIAEGDERGTDRQSVYFFNVAKASCAEVITQLNLAFKLGYIDAGTLAHLEDLAEKIRASLKNLIKSRA